MSSLHTQNWRIAYASLALRLTATLSVSLMDTPQQRILEENVCRNYYRISDPSAIGSDDMVPEDLCKVGEVQAEVSHIQGLGMFFLTVPLILAAVPYLLSHHRLSNKPRTLLLNVVGATLSFVYNAVVLYFYNIFSPRWTWLAGMTAFIGGGDLVFYGLIQAIMAESIEINALSTFYIYTSAIALVLKTLGNAGALLIMGWSLWLPILLSIGGCALGLPIISIFMRDLPREPVYSKEHSIPLASLDESDDLNEGLVDENLSKKPPSMRTLLAQQRDIFLKYLFPMSMFSLYEIGNSFRVILPYWFSKRYHWSLRDNGWVQLGITILTAIIVAILPRVSKHIQKQNPGWTSKDRDLNLANMCLGFYVIGVTLLGFSWHRISGVVSLVVMAGGTAFRDSYMGYLTADMEKEEVSKVFVVLEGVSLIAFSFGSWIVGDMYALSLKFEDSWATSLPMWACVIPYAACWYYLR